MNRTVVLLVCGIAVAACRAQEPWQQFGPRGVTVAAMANVPGYPDDVYFVSDGFPARLYYSSNRGQNWAVRETIPDLIGALAVDPRQVSVMYAAGKTRNVYRSVNSGQTWQVRGSLPQSVRVHQFIVNPLDGNRLWAAADVAGADSQRLAAFVSTDGGSDWTEIDLGSSHDVRALLLAMDPARPYRVFVGGSLGNVARAFRTDDDGATWTDISPGLAGTCAYGVAVSPGDSMTLICATDAGLFRSTDLGSTWTRSGSFPAYSAAFARASPHYGYAGSDNLVYRSNDNGTTWFAETTAFAGTDTRWLGLNPSLPLELYAGNGRGMFYSTDGGFSWTERTLSMSLLNVPVLSFVSGYPDTVFAAVPGVGALSSRDRGRTWTELGRFPGLGFCTSVAANPRHPDTLVCVTRFDSRLHMTTDRGDSWVSYPIAGHFEANGVAYHPAGPDTLYAWGGLRDSAAGPTRFAVFKSTSQGETWALNLSRPGPGECLGFSTNATGETLYAWGKANNGPALLRSRNRGQNWTGIASGLSGGTVRHFSLGPADTSLLFCATPTGVFRSQDSGVSWTRLGLANVSAVLPDTAIPEQLWAGTDTEGVYFTTDGGLDWERDTVGLYARTVLFLLRHPAIPSAVYLGAAGASLFGRGVIGVEESGSTPPVEPRLLIVPTLVTGRALVRLVPSLSTASLELYGTDGRLACHIGSLAPGARSFTWTLPRELPAGVYVLVLDSADGKATAKLLIARRI